MLLLLSLDPEVFFSGDTWQVYKVSAWSKGPTEQFEDRTDRSQLYQIQASFTDISAARGQQVAVLTYEHDVIVMKP